MNIDHLAVFVDLAETLNFRKTAERKNLSQPAVSQNIIAIEREIGTKLFERSRRGVTLTPSGRVFYQDMKSVINSYYKGVQETRSKANHNGNSITIGITNTPFENCFLPEIVTKFRQKNSKANVFIQSFDHNTLKRQLLQRECDLIFATEDDFIDKPDVKYVPLIKGFFIAEVPRQNSLAQRTSLELNDFNHQHIILMDNSWCPPEQFMLQEKIRKQNQKIHIAYVNNVAVGDLMCRSNLGITMMPNFIAAANERTRLIPIDYDCSLSYGIALNRDTDSDALKQFISFCQDYSFCCEDMAK